MDGRARVRGVAELSVGFQDLANAVYGTPGYALPAGAAPGLEATKAVPFDALSYANGCHVAEIEVDPETGRVEIVRYIVVHDCGRMINPLIVDGQVQGGVAQGLGNAILERIEFDRDAQPLTTTLADYMIAGACDLPSIAIPSPRIADRSQPAGRQGGGRERHGAGDRRGGGGDRGRAWPLRGRGERSPGSPGCAGPGRGGPARFALTARRADTISGGLSPGFTQFESRTDPEQPFETANIDETIAIQNKNAILEWTNLSPAITQCLVGLSLLHHNFLCKLKVRGASATDSLSAPFGGFGNGSSERGGDGC